MVTLARDTAAEIEELQIERLRRLPPWRKLALMSDMSQTVRALALAGLQQRYPEETPAQRKRRLADLLLGEELAAQIYGPQLEEPSC